MDETAIESHNLLDKLTIIKGCLSLLLEEEEKNDTEQKKLLKRAFEATEDLVGMIKRRKNL